MKLHLSKDCMFDLHSSFYEETNFYKVWNLEFITTYSWKGLKKFGSVVIFFLLPIL